MQLVFRISSELLEKSKHIMAKTKIHSSMSEFVRSSLSACQQVISVQRSRNKVVFIKNEEVIELELPLLVSTGRGSLDQTLEVRLYSTISGTNNLEYLTHAIGEKASQVCREAMVVYCNLLDYFLEGYKLFAVTPNRDLVPLVIPVDVQEQEPVSIPVSITPVQILAEKDVLRYFNGLSGQGKKKLLLELLKQVSIQ